jgi:hypothetical protein
MSVISEYVSIQDSAVTGTTGFASYSTNAGNNTGWIIYAANFITDLNFLNIQDSNATPQFWYAGSGSTNSGNNTGWLFTGLFVATDIEAFSSADIKSAVQIQSSDITEFVLSEESQAAQANFSADIVENSQLLSLEDTTNNVFNPDIVEAFQSNDVPTVSGLFNSAIVEPSTLADTELGLAVFAGSVVEDAVYAEAQATQVNFNGVVIENTTLLDFPGNQNGIFNSSILENIIILDGQVPRGWFKINDTQNPNWTPINNSQ